MKTIIWVIGISGLVMNLLVVGYHAKMIRENGAPKHIVLMSLAVADSVTDSFLIGLSIADSRMDGTYAKYENSWRRGGACFSLAIAQNVAMESSLSSLALYSMLHLIGIVHNIKPQLRSIVGLTLAMWLIVLSISSTPLLLTSTIEMDLCILFTFLHQNLAMFFYNIILHFLINGGLLMLSILVSARVMIKIYSIRKKVQKIGAIEKRSNKGIFAWLTLQVVCILYEFCAGAQCKWSYSQI